MAAADVAMKPVEEAGPPGASDTSVRDLYNRWAPPASRTGRRRCWAEDARLRGSVGDEPRQHPSCDTSRPPSARRLKALEQELQFIEIQEEYVKEEQKALQRELLHAQEEVKRIQVRGAGPSAALACASRGRADELVFVETVWLRTHRRPAFAARSRCPSSLGSSSR